MLVDLPKNQDICKDLPVRRGCFCISIQLKAFLMVLEYILPKELSLPRGFKAADIWNNLRISTDVELDLAVCMDPALFPPMGFFHCSCIECH